MKAVLLTEINKIAVTDIPELEASGDQSVIRVLACGICGTDRHIYKGEYPSAKPVVLGHEFGGEVVFPSKKGNFSNGD